MKQLLFRRFVASFLFFAVCTPSWAYDFVSDGIYYNINSDNISVTVTYKTTSYNSYFGSISIPSKVTYSSKTYNVTSIGDYAFYNCSSLTSIIIPENVISIGSYAFRNCSGLGSIKVGDDNTKYDSRDNCNAIVETATNTLVLGCKNTIIPNNVTIIGSSAFSGCSGMTSISIPDNVKVIEGSAFNNCTGLKEAEFASIESLCKIQFTGTDSNPLRYSRKLYINGQEITDLDLVIPESVTSISGYAFQGCNGLKSVTVHSGVTSIGTLAFNGCKNLETITIPNSVSSIGDDAFLSTPWYDNQPNGMVYIGKVAYKYKGTMPSGTHIELNEGTLGIAGHAFYQCSGLESITIPEGVTNIGERAFFECSSITSINIPNSVTSIGDYALQKCTSLTSIPVPNGVTNIGMNAFNQTPWYDNQPDGMVYAGKVAYKYKGTIPDGTHIKLKEGTLGIAGSAFQTASGITPGLESITIPNSVTTIGTHAFYGCTSLTSITIPESVTSIKRAAFIYCSGLASVTCQAPNVPATEYNCFKDIELSTAILYVPESSIEEYRATVPWSGFGTILPIYLVGDANGNGEVEIGDVTSVLTLMATPEATGYNNKAADANGNGEIEIGDVTTILTIMAGN